MNQQQFILVASKSCRNDNIRNAAYDVFFEGLTPYHAERKYNCPPGTVYRAVDNIKKHFNHCLKVATAK